MDSAMAPPNRFFWLIRDKIKLCDTMTYTYLARSARTDTTNVVSSAFFKTQYSSRSQSQFSCVEFGSVPPKFTFGLPPCIPAGLYGAANPRLKRAPDSYSNAVPRRDINSPRFSEYCAPLPCTSYVYGVGYEDSEDLPFLPVVKPAHSRRNKQNMYSPDIPQDFELLSEIGDPMDDWLLKRKRRARGRKKRYESQCGPARTVRKPYKSRKRKSRRPIVRRPIVTQSQPACIYPRFNLYSNSNSYRLFKIANFRDFRTWGACMYKHSYVRVYEPQFGVSDTIETVKTLASSHGLPVPDNILSRVEDLALLLLQLRDVNSTTQLIAILLAYYKTLISGSILTTVETFVLSLFMDYEGQAGAGDPNWLNHLREGKTNWNIILRSVAFEKISTLLSLCVALGLCQAGAFAFSIGNFKLFSIEAQKKHASALDLIDAFVSTVFYFVEGGYRVFTTGSITPLIYSNFEAKAFEEDFRECERLSEYAKTGDLKRLGNSSTNEYDCLLLNTLDKGNLLLNMTSSVSEKAVYRSRLDRLSRLQTELIQTRLTSGLRHAPFTVSFFGSSAQGKSTIGKLAMSTMLNANGFASAPENICGINETDKFMSTYRSNVTGVFLDDVGNSKPDFVDRPPSQILIDLNNNVPTYALQAEADKKGKVVIEPKIVICTTNVKDLGGAAYSNEPASIARRAHLHITTCAKPFFTVNGMLNSAKVYAHYPDRNQLIHDIWDFKVETVVAVKSISGGPDSVSYIPIEHNGKKLEKIGVVELLQVLVDLSRRHFLEQDRVVADAENFAKLQFCRPCGMPQPLCSCPPPPPPPVKESCPKCGELKSNCKCPNDGSSCDDDDISLPELGPAIAAIDELLNDETMPEPRTEPKRKMEGQFGPAFALGMKVLANSWFNQFSVRADELGKRLDEYATARLYELANMFEKSFLYSWTNYIPSKWLKSDAGKSIVAYMEKKSILGFMRSKMMTAGVLFGASTFLSVCSAFNVRMPWYVPFVVPAFLHYGSRLPRVVQYPLFWFSAGAPLIALPPIAAPSSLATAIAFSKLISFGGFMSSAVTLPCCACAVIPIWLTSLTFAPFIYFNLRDAVKCRDIVIDRIIARNDAMSSLVKKYRDNNLSYLSKYAVVVTIIYAMCQLWKQVRVVPEGQSTLSPTDMEEIERRDTNVNPWAVPEVKPIPCSDKSRSVTHNVLCDLVYNNLAYMYCELDDQRFGCDAFFPFSNVAIVPNHIWKKDVMLFKFLRRDPSTLGANFQAYLAKHHSSPIPNTDFCVVWVPNGGDWKDLRGYFPLDRFANCFATLIYKDRDGKRKQSSTTMIFGYKSTEECANFFGSAYHLEFNTFRGLCMAPLVTHTKGPVIGGFHIGGISTTTEGCSGFITLNQLEDAVAKLADNPEVLLSASSGTLRPKVFDVQWFEGPQIHEKSPLNFLPEGLNCEVYGSCIGRSKYFSEVVKLPISDTVERVMNFPLHVGKPKFSTKAWRESLTYSLNTAPGFPPPELAWAVEDMCTQLDTVLLAKAFKPLINSTRPLTQMQTLCGIDGKRFIDKMPPTTSVGYPLSGMKSKYIELLPPEDFPDFNCPAILDSKFWDEVTLAEKRYLDGERAYPIFKACLKDEPTPLTKDKVRIFQAAPMSLQLMMRQRFLPLARIMSLFPLVSECAVGLNAQSPEWHEMMTHVGKYGTDRVLAGDYSKYDLRMPAQVLFAAFKVLMHIALRCGYSEYDLIIMHGIATDVCYPLMAYNGDVIQHFGSNPSGQNLTVYINCICNSLLFRCGARSIVGEKCPKFSDICALITYGDDATSTVSKYYPQFNHVTYAAYLARHDIKFTLPDKGDTEATEYMSLSDSGFLKRDSVEVEGTGITCGALAEESIFKSLHCVIKSKAVTTAEQAIANLNGAAREFFFHGRAVYNTRCAQLQQVAAEHGYQGCCQDIYMSFDDRLQAWRDKYLAPPVFDLGGR